MVVGEGEFVGYDFLVCFACVMDGTCVILCIMVIDIFYGGDEYIFDYEGGRGEVFWLIYSFFVSKR